MSTEACTVLKGLPLLVIGGNSKAASQTPELFTHVACVPAKNIPDGNENKILANVLPKPSLRVRHRRDTKKELYFFPSHQQVIFKNFILFLVQTLLTLKKKDKYWCIHSAISRFILASKDKLFSLIYRKILDALYRPRDTGKLQGTGQIWCPFFMPSVSGSETAQRGEGRLCLILSFLVISSLLLSPHK